MAIKRIKVKNFKSFKELDVELGDLNILIGANASGKSNFVEIFRFLRNVRGTGLRNAISLQGGVEYLRNMNVNSSEVLSLEIVSDQKFPYLSVISGWDINVYETVYKFALAFDDKGLGFDIAKDKITQKCTFIGPKKESRSGKIVLSNVNGKMKIDLEKPAEVPIKPDDISPPSVIPERLPDGSLLIEFTHLPMIFQSLERLGNDISIYDFDPKRPKRFAPIAAIAELEEDGDNLAIALRNIIRSEDGKRKLMNLVTYPLDFVDDLDVERISIDKSLLLKIRETYSDEFLPISLISDGTVSMIALVIALYFGKKSLTIIEEPGQNIHPYLISKVVHMMEDASENKQIIVTTHNPEMVKHAELENILLVSRDESGFSSICNPSEKEDVRIFLKNGLRVEDLYVDSLLETL